MPKIKFEMLEKKCKEVAAEFMEELELLPIFLNYYPDVQDKWLKEIKLTEKEISSIKGVIDEYAKQKVALQNKKLPKTRQEVIELENDILQKMYEGRLMVLKAKSPLAAAKKILKQSYQDSAVVDPKQLEKLENLTLFKEHQKRFPWNFLFFDSKNSKII